MIEKNSGIVYQVKLESNLGFGFVEVYDFTDISAFDGRLAYGYNHVVDTPSSVPPIDLLRGEGVAIGPVRFYKFPNRRGVGAWKLLYQEEHFLISEIPPYKYHQAFSTALDWSDSDRWYAGPHDFHKGLPKYVNHERVRELETTILNSPLGLVKKMSMKLALDRGLEFEKLFDLRDLGTRNMFVQLVNTYYSLDKCRTFLRMIPDGALLNGG